jgi:hypothetical protein
MVAEDFPSGEFPRCGQRVHVGQYTVSGWVCRSGRLGSPPASILLLPQKVVW